MSKPVWKKPGWKEQGAKNKGTVDDLATLLAARNAIAPFSPGRWHFSQWMFPPEQVMEANIKGLTVQGQALRNNSWKRLNDHCRFNPLNIAEFRHKIQPKIDIASGLLENRWPVRTDAPRETNQSWRWREPFLPRCPRSGQPPRRRRPGLRSADRSAR